MIRREEVDMNKMTTEILAQMDLTKMGAWKSAKAGPYDARNVRR